MFAVMVLVMAVVMVMMMMMMMMMMMVMLCVCAGVLPSKWPRRGSHRWSSYAPHGTPSPA
jgi:hypothetical protein